MADGLNLRDHPCGAQSGDNCVSFGAVAGTFNSLCAQGVKDVVERRVDPQQARIGNAHIGPRAQAIFKPVGIVGVFDGRRQTRARADHRVVAILDGEGEGTLGRQI